MPSALFYSRTWLFVHPVYTRLHLLGPISHSIPPLPHHPSPPPPSWQPRTHFFLPLELVFPYNDTILCKHSNGPGSFIVSSQVYWGRVFLEQDSPSKPQFDEFWFIHFTSIKVTQTRLHPMQMRPPVSLWSAFSPPTPSTGQPPIWFLSLWLCRLLNATYMKWPGVQAFLFGFFRLTSGDPSTPWLVMLHSFLLLSVVSMRGGWTTVCFSVSPFMEVWAFPSDYNTGADKYSLMGLWASLWLSW